jgi:Domain of unknown function (DUF222)/HNH endonuclease
VPEPRADHSPSGADILSASAARSNEELRASLDAGFRQIAAAIGRVIVDLGEVDRRQAFREEGATSTEAWAVERFGIATSTARSLKCLGEKAWDIPELIGSMCSGDLSFDKVRVIADVATPETDRQLRDQAAEHSVRELAEVARTTARPADVPTSFKSDHDRRFLRFNDQFRTITAQLPAESYARTKACLEARARKVPTDGGTPWDQRLCDGFLELMLSPTPGAFGLSTTSSREFVVVHVPIEALVDDSIEPTHLAGELGRDDLIDVETVQRIACDAIVAVAVDDDVGHTMYEGRARREPTDAQRREVMRRDRDCRFPGCTNVTFTNVHHIVPWKPGGRTDLENLALLCLHHHRLVHSNDWSMSGNANEEITIVGPTGRVMLSRPSPLWTRVTADTRLDASS